MEPAGAQKMRNPSVEKNKLRYTEFNEDDDSKVLHLWMYVLIYHR